MLMEVLRTLRKAGIEVERLDLESVRPDGLRPLAVVAVRTGEVGERFSVEEKQRAPYPNELPRLRAGRKAFSRVGRALLVIPSCPRRLCLCSPSPVGLG